REAYDSAQHTRSLYDALIAGGANGSEGEWLQSVEVRETVLNRLADAQAQIGYLTREARYFGELEETLALLGCDYIRKYRTAADPMYARIPTPRKIRD